MKPFAAARAMVALRRGLVVLTAAAFLCGVGCGASGEGTDPASTDSGTPADANASDAGSPGAEDVGGMGSMDGWGVDAASPADTGGTAPTDVVEAGLDAAPDAGPDVGSDVGPDVAPPPPTGRLLVTELMASNRQGLRDEHGRTPDWIELYNPGPEAVELAGWTISDEDEEPPKGALPDVSLPAGGFLVLFASGDDGVGGERHLPFQLSADGESVVLWEPDGQLADAVVFGPQRADVSWGRPQVVEARELVGPGSTATLRGAPEGDWTSPVYDDAEWDEVVLPAGYDRRGGVPAENLALGGATEQSSDGYGRTGAQAVDGDGGTFSHTADGDLEPWWRVDLGATASVTDIWLANRLNCCGERLYNVVVEVEDEDGVVVWRSAVLNPVADGAAPVSPGDGVDAGLDAAVVGRFVRVRKTAVGGTEWLSLAEVRVGGAWRGPYDDVVATDTESALATGRAGFRLSVPAATADRITLETLVDDRATFWLDGELLFEGDPSQEPRSDPEPVDVAAPERVLLDPQLFVAGERLLAVELVDLDGEDAVLGVRLVAESIETRSGERAWFETPTPGAPNGLGWSGLLDAPDVEPGSAIADAPFEATLSTGVPGASLVYTLDGSVPTLANGVAVAGDEAGATVRVPVDGTTVLRARAFADGMGASEAATRTWLFAEDVIRQPAAPDGVPATWAGLGQAPIAADYEMDPEVALDPDYTEDLLRGLRAIPSLSVVIEPEDLWGDERGIYVHSTQRGAEWERPATVELIRNDGLWGVQERCGIRIHGYGWRAHTATKKHAFRLEFRSRYGASKLAYPLFPDAPVERFDSIVLRSQGSRSWQDFRDPAQAQYIRDAFARDTAWAMGKADGHAAYVHLYLNGLYWGLYMAVERPDADFAAERFGGDADEWDAINRRTSTNEAIDGDLAAYEELLARADADLSDDEAAAAVEAMLDLDDLVDYMLIHQYTTNLDGPERFQSNNMRGVRRRTDGGQFRFFVWDMEYSLWDAHDDANIDVDVPGSISHVYTRLRANESFRRRYAERAQAHLTGDGALTPAACLQRWRARAREIEDAVVAESARWGDTDREVPYTRDVEWLAERRRLEEEYFPYRTAALIELLRAADLYPAAEPEPPADGR